MPREQSYWKSHSKTAGHSTWKILLLNKSNQRPFGVRADEWKRSNNSNTRPKKVTEPSDEAFRDEAKKWQIKRQKKLLTRGNLVPTPGWPPWPWWWSTWHFATGESRTYWAGWLQWRKKPEIQYKHPTTCLIRQYKVPLERLSASHFRSFETTLDEIRQIDSRQKRVQAAHFQSLRGRWQIGGKQVRRPID